MAASPSGFALRLNGSSCLGQEVDCGTTLPPYRVCCPESSFCPSQYNVNCCPSAANCTAALVQQPRCANATWDLYDNNGFFCCLKGLFGYAARETDSNGCGSEGYILKSGEVRLPLIRAGEGPTNTPSSSTTASSQATSSTPAPSSSSTTPPTPATGDGDSSSGSKIGIGVGVAVGVLALILVAWLAYWLRNKKKKKSARSELPDTVPMTDPHQDTKYHTPYHPELEARQTPVEMSAYREQPAELDGHYR
ncbi:hypothetical protein B0H67DRAFT_261506 [Lasiosphaeris hirsuta]|uniref:Uncharacterized protein n=1 Tax=Lasiosphaeris hirsuta TaxID=260670 RepID=A0AA40AIA2_9PEZI|nr:hypothetical protein B0H67DRAFT_261506 [Lasiosphaeris hirsuta]